METINKLLLVLIAVNVINLAVNTIWFLQC